MMKFHRPARPDVPKDWKRLGKEWQQRRKENSNTNFYWPTVDGQNMREALVTKLKGGTEFGRCHFCDGHLGLTSRETIEHFRSKSGHPRLAYFWGNLFLACDLCQQNKGSKEPDRALKPDRPTYSFERYFIIHFASGALQPNPSASRLEQEQAEATKPETGGALMKLRQNHILPPALQAAQQQFEQWRLQRRRGEKIPPDLWEVATQLGRRYGVTRVATTLALGAHLYP